LQQRNQNINPNPVTASGFPQRVTKTEREREGERRENRERREKGFLSLTTEFPHHHHHHDDDEHKCDVVCQLEIAFSFSSVSVSSPCSRVGRSEKRRGKLAKQKKNNRTEQRK